MNEHESFNEGSRRDIETAEAEIAMIRQDIYMMGANDTEMSDLDAIVASLRDGTYSPEEALRKARKIGDRKMDYH
jgi:hypothetical protein